MQKATRVRSSAALALLPLALVGCSQSDTGTTAGAAASASTGTSDSPSAVTSSAATSTSATSASGGSGGVTCSYPASGSAAKPVNPPSTTGVPNTGTVTVTMKLASGDIVMTLDRAKAPCTVNSFVSLAKQGYFTNTKCHRLTTQGIFVLQCGDPTGTGSGGPGYKFADELTGKETYPKGTVAMANAGADTNGSQFFLVYEDSTSNLQPLYTVFGSMSTASTQVVQKIADQGTTNGASDGTPAADTKITAVTLS